jgi:hypothetical protein
MRKRTCMVGSTRCGNGLQQQTKDDGVIVSGDRRRRARGAEGGEGLEI